MKKLVWPAFLFLALISNSIYSSAIADTSQGVENLCSTSSVLVAATAAIVVGTPIATTRITGKSINSIFHEYDGDSFSYKFWGRPFCLPVGILAGTIKGCIVGPKNAIRYAKEKPFSKESFSLKDLQ
jgi:hypothetical protein